MQQLSISIFDKSQFCKKQTKTVPVAATVEKDKGVSFVLCSLKIFLCYISSEFFVFCVFVSITDKYLSSSCFVFLTGGISRLVLSLPTLLEYVSLSYQVWLLYFPIKTI